MKVKVVTGFVGDCPYRSVFEKNVREYCRLHGYLFAAAFNDGISDDSYAHPKGIWWRKQAIIKKELEGCDRLLWIDTDCVIINKQIRIEDFGMRNGVDIIVSATEPELAALGHGRVETGVMLFRSCKWTSDFIDEWSNYEDELSTADLTNHINNNHEVLNRWLDSEDTMPFEASHIKILPSEDFTIKHIHYSKRTSKTFVMHVPGSSMDDKLKFMTEAAKQFNWQEDIHAEYINLDHRDDRNERMKNELQRVGLNALRRRGLPWKEVEAVMPNHKIDVMLRRTPGAIGCHYSQVAVMEEAFKQGKSSMVMEDDLVFCSDIKQRLEIIQNFLNCHEWDVFWLGGTYHATGNGWHTPGHNPDLQMCKCELGKDVEATEDKHIVRTYGCWSTYAYIVNYKSLTKILELLDMNVYRSMGIDWLFILLQPQLKTFAFVPGCVKQYDNLSDIGLNGNRPAITHFSGFANLGAYWWQDRMNDFDYNSFKC